MAGIPDKTIIFRKFDLWWPLLTSIFTWAKKWPIWLWMGSLRDFDCRMFRPSSFPSFLVSRGVILPPPWRRWLRPPPGRGLSAPFMLSPTSVILYGSLMDVSSAMTLMSEQNNLTWFATELSKQSPHLSCQPRVTDGLSALFMLSPTSVILYKSLMDVTSVIGLTSLSKTTWRGS